MNLEDEYDIFVCYCEDTGKDPAETVRRVLQNKRNYKVFVAHIYRDLIQGDYREKIDGFISKCRIFIFIMTFDALNSEEIIREVTVAFPNGDITKHAFWILRDGKFEIPRDAPYFQQRTNINLSNINQSTYKNDSDLASIVLSKCDEERRPVKDTPDEELKASPPLPIALTVRLNLQIHTEINPTHLQRFRNEIENKNYEAALRILDTELAHIPQLPPEIIHDRALLMSNLGRNQDALGVLDTLIAHQPDNKDAHYLKAFVLQNMGKYSEAIKYYDNVLSADPKNVKAMSSKASALAEIHKIDQAATLLEQALRIDSRFSSAWYNLGVILSAQGKQLEAYMHIIKLSNLIQPT